ncbi:hypothetical protein Goshw_021418 [Gossypium schwendimanii]|uniref:RNase H type-1 domain-containing protein n=1 Tax=Gossypium schwendimanii TaxID=34291 RepID=A0A7J9MVF0_GOSSC|nr:hypothetical protein [Gossypium schwendimanii]
MGISHKQFVLVLALFLGEETVSNEHVSTAEMINECGEWDWNRLHALLPDEILRRFAAKRSPMMVMLTTFLDGVGINIYAACGNGVETIDHVLRFCFLTMSVWLLLIRPEKLYKFMSMSIEEWLFANITDAEQLALDPDNWAGMFEALCWCLWKQRNSRIFIQGHVDQDSVINGARQLCSVQAAVSQNQSRCHEADIWGAYDGLMLAWELGSSRVILEMDSSEVVTMLKRPLDASSNCATVRDVGRLLRRSWEVQIVHAYREGNQASDALANHAFKCPLVHKATAPDMLALGRAWETKPSPRKLRDHQLPDKQHLKNFS